MYAKNTVGRRRPSGWVERRRYFQRLFDLLRGNAVKKEEESQKVAPAAGKD
jgi:hypothetical protein